MNHDRAPTDTLPMPGGFLFEIWQQQLQLMHENSVESQSRAHQAGEAAAGSCCRALHDCPHGLDSLAAHAWRIGFMVQKARMKRAAQ